MTIYFVSGHVSITPEEFKLHYALLLDWILDQDDDASFIIGDANGADAMAQEHLYGRTERVTICHMFTSPRNNPGFDKLVGGFTSDDERDAYMTSHSDVDIAWIRPGKEKSGTARNIARRLKNESILKALENLKKLQ